MTTMSTPNYKLGVISLTNLTSQVTLPANLLCFDLLSFVCNRGDGRFVLKKNRIQYNYKNIYFQIRIKPYLIRRPINLNATQETLITIPISTWISIKENNLDQRSDKNLNRHTGNKNIKLM